LADAGKTGDLIDTVVALVRVIVLVQVASPVFSVEIPANVMS
jgi:hypothetical protein